MKYETLDAYLETLSPEERELYRDEIVEAEQRYEGIVQNERKVMEGILRIADNLNQLRSAHSQIQDGLQKVIGSAHGQINEALQKIKHKAILIQHKEPKYKI